LPHNLPESVPVASGEEMALTICDRTRDLEDERESGPLEKIYLVGPVVALLR
jgi:hypothetical protein